MGDDTAERIAALEKRLAALEEPPAASSQGKGGSADTGAANIVRLFNRGESVIIGQASALIFGVVSVGPVRLEISIAIVVSFFIWAMADNIVRKWVTSTSLLSDKEKTNWREVLVAVLDFVMLAGIFLVVQIFLDLVRDAISSSGLGVFESIVGVFVAMMAVFSLINWIKSVAGV